MPISAKKSLIKLGEEILTCKKCLDLVKIRKQPVPGKGAYTARLIITGYYPSRNGSEATGIPFTNDDEGSIVRKLIHQAGLSLDNDVFLTYLVKCSPGKKEEKDAGSFRQGQIPSAKHIVNCLGYLTEEISIITPHIIIALGLSTSSIILERFFSIDKKSKDMAKLHMRLFENPSFKLVPFYSPKEVIMGNVSETKYFDDFKTLARLFAVI